MKLAYFRLRWRIFSYEVRSLSTQIENLAIGLIAFMGVALPALFYLVLLGLGLVLDQPEKAQQAIASVLTMLVLQTLILLLYQKAITAQTYQDYLVSLNIKRAQRLVCDIVLIMICTPLVALLLIILLAIPIDDWVAVLHGFALLSLFVCYSLLAVFQAHRLLFLLMFDLLLFAVVTSLTLNQFLLVAHLAIILTLIKFPKVAVNHILVPVQARICLGFMSQHRWLYINASLAFVIFALGSQLLSSNLPQYQTVLMALGLQFVCLIAVSLHVSMNRHISEFSTYYQSLKNTSFVKVWQFLPSFLMYFIGMSTFFVFNAFSVWSLLSLFIYPSLLWIAFKYEQRLMIVWVSITVLLLILIAQFL